MRVRVIVNAVVLDGLRVRPSDRAGLLARLEAAITDQLSGLPAQTWARPADGVTAGVQSAVTAALGVKPAGLGHRLGPARPTNGVRPAPRGSGSWA